MRRWAARAAECGARGFGQAHGQDQRQATGFKRVKAAGEVSGRDHRIVEVDDQRVQCGLGAIGVEGAERRLGPAAHDLDPKRAGATVEFLDPHEDAHRLRLGQDAFGDTGGEGFQQVEPFGGKLGRDRLGQAVVGQDAVDIVVDRGGMRADLDHDVEADALGGAAFGLKGADLDRDGVIAQADAVARVGAGGCLGARLGMGEGEAYVRGHGGSVAGRCHATRAFARIIGRLRRAGYAKPRRTSARIRRARPRSDQFEATWTLSR